MFANFIAEKCQGTGNTITLYGTEDQHLAFSVKFSDTDEVKYVIEDGDGIKKCGGVGTYNSNNTITRNDSWSWDGTTYDESPVSNITLSGQTHTIRVTPLTDDINNWNIAYDHSQAYTGNPHNVTKTDVGLSNVNNTSDVNKPISQLTQLALDYKQPRHDTLSGKTDTDTLDFSRTNKGFIFKDYNGFSDISQVVLKMPDYTDITGLSAELNNRPEKAGTETITGDWVFHNKYFYAISTFSTTITDTPNYVTIPINSIIRKDALYSSTFNEVVVSIPGWYKITYTCAFEYVTTSSNRFSVCARIEVNDGSGFSPISGSSIYTYHRNETDGYNSGTKTILVNLGDGDGIRLSATVLTGPSSSSIKAIANECNIVIEKM